MQSLIPELMHLEPCFVPRFLGGGRPKGSDPARRVPAAGSVGPLRERRVAARSQRGRLRIRIYLGDCGREAAAVRTWGRRGFERGSRKGGYLIHLTQLPGPFARSSSICSCIIPTKSYLFYWALLLCGFSLYKALLVFVLMNDGAGVGWRLEHVECGLHLPSASCHLPASCRVAPIFW